MAASGMNKNADGVTEGYGVDTGSHPARQVGPNLYGVPMGNMGKTSYRAYSHDGDQAQHEMNLYREGKGMQHSALPPSSGSGNFGIGVALHEKGTSGEFSAEAAEGLRNIAAGYGGSNARRSIEAGERAASIRESNKKRAK